MNLLGENQRFAINALVRKNLWDAFINHFGILKLSTALFRGYMKNKKYNFFRLNILKLLALSITFACCSVYAQHTELRIHKNDVQQTLKNFIISGGEIHGSLLMSQQGEIVFSEGYGYSNREKGLENSDKTQFLAASITKQFTAAALIKLLYLNEKESKGASSDAVLDNLNKKLNKPLAAYLSNNDPIWGGVAPDWSSQVTLHDLLSNRSGIVNYTQDEKFYGEFYKQNDKSLQKLISLFKNNKLNFKPGSEWEYSDSNYVLLGVVLSRLNQSSYEEALEQLIFKPLNMSSSFSIGKGDNYESFVKKYPMLAQGYQYDVLSNKEKISKIPQFEEMLYTYATGSLVTTLSDLNKWNRDFYVENKVLPKEVVILMTKGYSQIGPDDSYGYGLFISNKNKKTEVIFHTGNIAGFSSKIYYYPSIDVTIAWYKNLRENQEQARNILRIASDKYSHIKNEDEKWDLEQVFIKNNFPLMQELASKYNFDSQVPIFMGKIFKE